MREHHAFRAAGRAGGIEDVGEIVLRGPDFRSGRGLTLDVSSGEELHTCDGGVRSQVDRVRRDDRLDGSSVLDQLAP